MVRNRIPSGITREHVLLAIADFRRNAVRHRFGDSTKYDLLHEGQRLPPKAIVGLAAGRLTGVVLAPGDFTGGEESACFRLLRRLDFAIVPKAESGAEWSEAEYRAAVASYMLMLERELAGEKYSKTEFRNALLVQMPGRSKGSAELRHQNISAALLARDLPFIQGYKPRKNFNAVLHEHIDAYLDAHPALRRALVDHAATAQIDASPPTTSLVEVPPPQPAGAPGEAASPRRRTAQFVDYLSAELRNRRLGRQGEQLVVEHERAALIRAGRADLAAKVEWIADTQGDGLGYDIQSFELDGSPCYIEVKTTRNGIDHPFIITANEVAASQELGAAFRIARVFGLPVKPEFYVLRGSLRDLERDGRCRLDPRQFVVRLL